MSGSRLSMIERPDSCFRSSVTRNTCAWTPPSGAAADEFSVGYSSVLVTSNSSILKISFVCVERFRQYPASSWDDAVGAVLRLPDIVGPDFASQQLFALMKACLMMQTLLGPLLQVPPDATQLERDNATASVLSVFAQ